MDRTFTPAAVIDLAETVERDGLDAHASTLFALADAARAVGVSPVVVDVMLDDTQPVVARVRAFTLAAVAVAHRAVRGSTGSGTREVAKAPALV